MDRTVFKSSTLWILLAAFAAGLLGLFLGRQLFSTATGAAIPTARGDFKGRVLLYPEPRPLAEFSLQRPDASLINNKTLSQGRWTAVFFGFSHCPDICPTTLGMMAAVNKQLKQTLPADKLPQLLFVSVDSERDLGPKLGEYVSYFSPDIVASSGDVAQIENFTRLLGAQYYRQPSDDKGEYSVDHSADLFLIGPDGTRRGLIRPPFTAAALIADLGALAK